MKLEDWQEALDGWQKFYTQMLIDITKTEFYIEALEKKIKELKAHEGKNGE